MPDLGIIRRARTGNKVSRFFKHIFEHKSIKRIFGVNLAFVIAASSFMPVNTPVEAYEEKVIISAEAPLSTQKGVQWPVKEVKISQGYKLFHPALDLDGITGDPIYPVMGGIVEAVEYSRFAYGNAVIIKHGNSMTTLYAHLSKINVQKDQEVTKDTVIGEMGATGRSWGDHLHLEVRDHGFPINPYSILPSAY